MRSWIILLVAIECSIPPARAQSSSDDLLEHVRARVMDTVKRLPNYMCTQTIDRLQYEPEGRLKVRSCAAIMNLAHTRLRFTTSDRLRLDVAMTSGVEIYSWVGENRFDDRGLMELVSTGPVSTGSFSSFLGAIFDTDGATFSRLGPKTFNHRRLVEFDYSVPREKSQFRVRSPGKEWGVTAYAGTFLVDPTSFDLVRLVVRTVQMPAGSGACEDVTTLDYGRSRLNNVDFLLPTETTLRIVHEGGIETENRTVYTACHEFRGESKLSFDAPTETATVSNPAKVAAPISLVLPPNLEFNLATSRDIAIKTAAAGDAVPARLITDIRNSSNDILVPAGTSATCRIARVQRFQSPPSLTLVLRLESLNIQGTAVKVPAALGFERVRSGPGWSSALLSIHRSPELSSREPDRVSSQPNPNTAVFEFSKVGSNHVIKSGLETKWITLSP